MAKATVTFKINDESLVVPQTEGFASTNGGVFLNTTSIGFLGTTAERQQGYMYVSNLNEWFARLNNRIIGMQGGPTFAAGNTFYSVGKCAASVVDGTYPSVALVNEVNVFPDFANWGVNFKPNWWAVHNFLQYGSGCYVGFKTSTITTPSSAFKDAEYDVLFASDFTATPSTITISEYRSSSDRPIITIIPIDAPEILLENSLVMETIISNQAPGTNTKDYVRVFGSKVHLNSTGTNTITTYLAPDVAGCIVRTDRDAFPWFSPAGVRRGRILNLVKLSTTLTKQSQDVLYNLGVNPVVNFPGEGTILYGDKTGELASSTLSRINVSRLFMYIKKALAPVARSVLFEQNDAFTRSRFKTTADSFLERILNQRGIQDFRVICDTSNNTPEMIEANQFVADILVKPITSVNYVLITLTNKDLSSTL